MEQSYPQPLRNTPSSLDPSLVVTKKALVHDLKKLGVEPGDTICVHSACSTIGYVIGGPRTILEALIEAAGPTGTIMMPTFTGDLSDPGEWRYPAVPPQFLQEVRQSLPGFNSALSPTRKMGFLPELFRHLPGAVRSPHPQSSFTALGRLAARLCDRHPLDYRFGPDSPLGALRDLGGKVLVLGAPWNTVSLFYLTEFSMLDRSECQKSAPIDRQGETKWVAYRDLVYRSCAYDSLIHLVENGFVTRGNVGQADCLLFSAREAIQETVGRRRSIPS